MRVWNALTYLWKKMESVMAGLKPWKINFGCQTPLLQNVASCAAKASYAQRLCVAQSLYAHHSACMHNELRCFATERWNFDLLATVRGEFDDRKTKECKWVSFLSFWHFYKHEVTYFEWGWAPHVFSENKLHWLNFVTLDILQPWNFVTFWTL